MTASHTLHNKLLKLPDQTLIYPAHGAGSMCGKSLSDEAYSTLGEQRKYKYRSSIAVSMLLSDGVTNVIDLAGGFKAWVQSKLPIIEQPVAH